MGRTPNRVVRTATSSLVLARPGLLARSSTTTCSYRTCTEKAPPAECRADSAVVWADSAAAAWVALAAAEFRQVRPQAAVLAVSPATTPRTHRRWLRQKSDSAT